MQLITCVSRYSFLYGPVSIPSTERQRGKESLLTLSDSLGSKRWHCSGLNGLKSSFFLYPLPVMERHCVGCWSCLHACGIWAHCDWFFLFSFIYILARTLSVHAASTGSIQRPLSKKTKKNLASRLPQCSSVFTNDCFFLFSVKCTESIPHFSVTLRRIPTSLCLPLALNSTIEHIFLNPHRLTL